MSKNFAVYVRRSLQTDDSASVERQKQQGCEAVTKLGYAPVTYQEPEGLRSGHSERARPAWRQLKADVKAGKLAGVWVADIARAARSVRDFLTWMDLVAESHILFISQKENVDTTTANGRLLLTVLSAMNQWYSEDLSERQKRAFAHKRATGKTYGRWPMGLRRDPKTTQYFPSEESYTVEGVTRTYFDTFVEVMRRFSDSRRVGCPTIALEMNAEGYRWRNGKRTVPLDGRVIFKALSDLRAYQGLVPDELIDNVQRRRLERRAKRENGQVAGYAPLLLQRVLYCAECGVRFTVRNQKPHFAYYYHPRNNCPYAGGHTRATYDDKIWELLQRSVKLSEEDRQDQIRRLSVVKKQPNAEQQKARLEQKLARTREMYIDGVFDREEFDRRAEQIAKQIDELGLPIVQSPPIPLPEARRLTANLVESWRIGSQYDPQAANALMRAIFQRVVVRGVVLVKVVPHPAYLAWFSV